MLGGFDNIFYWIFWTFCLFILQSNNSFEFWFCVKSNEFCFWICVDKPGKPENLHVLEILKDSIAIAWEPPANLGGCILKGYVIEKREANRNTWAAVSKANISYLHISCVLP